MAPATTLRHRLHGFIVVALRSDGVKDHRVLAVLRMLKTPSAAEEDQRPLLAVEHKQSSFPARHPPDVRVRPDDPAGVRVGQPVQPRLRTVFPFQAMQQNVELEHAHGAHDGGVPRLDVLVEDLSRPFLGQLAKPRVQLLPPERVFRADPGEVLRAEPGDPAEVDITVGRERVADTELPTVVQSDDITGPRFIDGPAGPAP
jgi:hypothetical protein